MNKKKNFINADDFWMGVALLMTVKAQSAAIIVNSYDELISCGVNGFPSQCDFFTSDEHGRHAEMVALSNISSGTAIYVTNIVCWNCVLEIISKNIRKIVYYPIGKINEEEKEKIDKIATATYLKIVEYKGNLNWMRDKINLMKKLSLF